MLKITFMGAGSTVFAKNVLGDVMSTPALRQCEIALYDIDADRLKESYQVLTIINANINEDRAVIKTYLGVENRKEALRGASFVVNAIQVGGYEPSTVIDFEPEADHRGPPRCRRPHARPPHHPRHGSFRP